MKFVCIIFAFISLNTIAFSQDTLSVTEKAKVYYSDLKLRYGFESADFNLKYSEKNGRIPSIDELSAFFKKFHKRERDSLIYLVRQKSNCIKTTIEFLEERLEIWQLMPGGSIPDSTFLVLMDDYYKIAPKSAVDFCISRWNYRKFHVMDIVEGHEVPWIKNYPYVVFLFDNLNTSDLLNILLEKNNLEINSNRDFIDLCIKELCYNKSKNELKNIEDYVKAKQEIDPGRQFNSYFISVYDKMYVEK